jgi:hypothetical protein
MPAVLAFDANPENAPSDLVSIAYEYFTIGFLKHQRFSEKIYNKNFDSSLRQCFEKGGRKLVIGKLHVFKNEL